MLSKGTATRVLAALVLLGLCLVHVCRGESVSVKSSTTADGTEVFVNGKPVPNGDSDVDGGHVHADTGPHSSHVSYSSGTPDHGRHRAADGVAEARRGRRRHAADGGHSTATATTKSNGESVTRSTTRRGRGEEECTIETVTRTPADGGPPSTTVIETGACDGNSAADSTASAERRSGETFDGDDDDDDDEFVRVSDGRGHAAARAKGGPHGDAQEHVSVTTTRLPGGGKRQSASASASASSGTL